jgi:2-polyprenyl-3-methyl-5-hydroxy-6-metoxy-1,4-benzoquinol methylase
MNNTCEICNNSVDNKEYISREMMFGTRDEFKYFECSVCGCLQINEVPSNIGEYYRNDYYSYNLVNENLGKGSDIKRFLKKQLFRYYLFHNNIIGQVLSIKFGNPYKWANKDIMNFNSKILDVGCGAGRLLLNLNESGFNDLTGIDPYIEKEISYECGVQIYKKEIKDLDERFDLIMLHHAFEHMTDPLSVFNNLYRLLNRKSYVLLRIPVASSFAWKQYKTNWVGLDAPRHFFLHTTKSIQILAEKSGFKIKNIKFDSSPMQFLRSELYMNNISLFDDNKNLRDIKKYFSEKQIKAFTIKSKELNSKMEGDSACFYLYKE